MGRQIQALVTKTHEMSGFDEMNENEHHVVSLGSQQREQAGHDNTWVWRRTLERA